MIENNSPPNVNFFVNYSNAKGGNQEYLEKRKFYSSNKNKDYMNYIMTGIKDMENMDYVEYIQNKHKCYGIFNQDGLISAEERKRIRNDLRKTKSVIWDALITFESEFGKKWCNSFEQAYNLLKNELPKFFKRAGLNQDNIEWFAGLHENTDNRHIHISFFEKKPLRIRPNKNEKQFSIGRIPKPVILGFKPIIELAATDFKAREILARQKINEKVKEELSKNSNLILKNKLLNLANKLPEGQQHHYSNDSMSFLRTEINSITDYVLSGQKNTQSIQEDFINLAREKDEEFAKYCKRNHCLQPYSFEEKYKQDMYRRVGNIVIQCAKDLKFKDDQRLKLNAKYKAEKIRQKNKFWKELDECLLLNERVNYEIIHSFQDFMESLERARYSRLVEEGELEAEM